MTTPPTPSAYLDHAAGTPVRPEVLAAMTPFLAGCFGNPSGGHAVARAAGTALEEARETLAALLGAAPGEVVLTSGGTEADHLGVVGAARAARAAGRGDGIVTTAFEHKAVLGAVDRLRHEGFRVSEVRPGPDGVVEPDALAAAVDAGTAVVSVMLVNNEVGTVQPLGELVTAARASAPHVVVHTDAVQGAPWLDLTGAAAAADLVAVSAHKVGGPKGVGALVVRDGTPLDPVVEGGGQERGRRAGTVNVAGAVAFAHALRLTAERRDREVAHVVALRDRLLGGLRAAVPDLVEHGTVGSRVPGIVPVAFPGVDSELLLVALDQAGVCASAGSSCSSGALEISHVLAAMQVPLRIARSTVRFSLGFASTAADVEHALAVVPPAVDRLRDAVPARP